MLNDSALNNFFNTSVNLKSSIQSKNNNFNLVRLGAALVVIGIHTVGEFGNYGILGVPAFFFISGLLVSESLRKNSSWKKYSAKRVLRIYPAAIVCIILSSLVMGPIVTTLSVSNYLSDPATYKFLLNCFLIRIDYRLPGVFTQRFLWTSSVNASLWTLPLELKLYAGLLIFYLIPFLYKRLFLILMILLLCFPLYFFNVQIEQFFYQLTGIKYDTWIFYTIVPYFLIGVLCNIYSHRIILYQYWLLAVIPLYFFSEFFSILNLTGFVLLPLFILLLATSSLPFIKKLVPKSDLSYGIYLYAFPIQQIISAFIKPSNNIILLLLTIAAVIPIAFCSWHLIEKKAMAIAKKY
jgi:peptidoglycan/LPS O-acetylase OafA/YrhL